MRWLWRTTVRLLAILGLFYVLVTVTPLVRWWAAYLAGPWHDPRGEILLVLGGSVLDEGMIGGSSYWRSVHGVLAYREGGIQQIVVTGGGGRAAHISEPMRDFMICHGVPAQTVRMETRSTSTREDALYTRDLISRSSGRRVLLTSDYHMWRAHRTFKKVGLEVLPRPIPDALKRAESWKGRWPAFVDLVVETMKIAYYYGRGWI